MLELRENDIVSESVCSPVKRSTLVVLCLSQIHFLLVFIATCYGDSSSWHWCLGLGIPLKGFTPQGRFLQLK